MVEPVKTTLRYLAWIGSAVLLLAALGLVVVATPFFGNKALIVRSGSMEPAISVGDLVIVRPHDGEYTIGDIVAYRSPANDQILITHRVVDISHTGDAIAYHTKGDANDTPDEYTIPGHYIVGRHLFTVPFVGKLLALAKTKAGFATLVVVPAILVMLGEGFVIFREMRKGKVKVTAGLEPPGVEEPPAPPERVPEQTPLEPVREGTPPESPEAVPDYSYHDDDEIPWPPLKPLDPTPRSLMDGISKRLVIFIAGLLVFSNSAYALYTDSGTSSGNVFSAASFFETDPYIDEVVAVEGTFGHCCSDLSNDPEVAEPLVTGAPDSPPTENFIQISDNTVITTRFVNNQANPSGNSNPDIRVYIFDQEFSGSAEIKVSQNCTSFTSLGIFPDTANIDLNIEGTGLAFVKCVQLIDQEAPDDPFPTLGFDLDAIEALNSSTP
jgi:signal peptidase I